MYFNNIQPLPWGGGFSVPLKGHRQTLAVFRSPYCTINCIPLRGREMTSSLSYSQPLHIHTQGFTLILRSRVHADVKTCHTTICTEKADLCSRGPDSDKSSLSCVQDSSPSGARIQQRSCLFCLSSFLTSNIDACKHWWDFKWKCQLFAMQRMYCIQKVCFLYSSSVKNLHVYTSVRWTLIQNMQT